MIFVRLYPLKVGLAILFYSWSPLQFSGRSLLRCCHFLPLVSPSKLMQNRYVGSILVLQPGKSRTACRGWWTPPCFCKGPCRRPCLGEGRDRRDKATVLRCGRRFYVEFTRLQSLHRWPPLGCWRLSRRRVLDWGLMCRWIRFRARRFCCWMSCCRWRGKRWVILC